MKLISSPITHRFHNSISVPGDRSISHRALILASIAQGQSIIRGLLAGPDCLASIRIFRSLGVNIEQVSPQDVVIQGVGKYGLQRATHALNCEYSLTSLRLLMGLLAGQSFDSELSVIEQMDNIYSQQLDKVGRPLLHMGARIALVEDKRSVLVRGNTELQGITYEVNEVSAQVKSCLLLAGLYAQQETSIIETGITRDHTERMLATFSYPLYKAENTIVINAGSECQGTDLMIPGDLSSAAFFIVAATLIKDSDLWITNVGINPARIGILHILKSMGAAIEVTNKRLFGEEPVADLHIRHAMLEGIDIPLGMVPLAMDEFPILFIAAACARGQTLLQGAKELRFKDSDRITVMIKGLQHLGIDAQELEDGVFIRGGRLLGGEVDSARDHRVAMAFAIAGAVASDPVVIDNCANMDRLFPNFIPLAHNLGFLIEEVDHHE